MRSIIAALLVLVSSPAAAAVHEVYALPDLSFDPATLVIRRGDAVVFRNLGGVHNVVADSGAFRCAINCTTNTAPSSQLWSATVQFRHAGSFGYFCEAHEGVMRGQIVVEFADGFESAPL
jgi:plastocyanin